MLSLQKTEPAFGAQLRDLPEPAVGEGEVLVEVEAVGICGSDVHMYEWTTGYEWLIPSLPVTMGHEFSGRIVKLGPGVSASASESGAGLAEGMPVVVTPGYFCGTCEHCLGGKPDACRQKKSIGLSVNGGFARFVSVPARTCIPIGEDLPHHIAALTEPLVVGDRAVQIGAIEPGQDVVVLGPGIIGLATAFIAKRAGAGSVTVVGKGDPLRLGIAQQLGADRVIDLADGSATLADHVPERSVDRVFEATGFPASITEGLGLLKDYGIMTAIGIHASPVSFDITPFVRRKLQLRGSHGGGRDSWDRVLTMLPENQNALGAIVTHQIPLSEAIEGFEMSRRREACKVIIRPTLAS